MKRIVGILALILAFSTLMTLMVGCDDDNNNGDNEIVYKDYTVTVVDGLGNPMSNVIVNFKNEAGESKMRVTEKDGIATYKNAPAGNYTVAIEQGYSDAIILQSEYGLTKDVTDVKVIVRDSKKTVDIYGDIPAGSFAYKVSNGENNIVAEQGNTVYYVFTPSVTGIYSFSLSSDSDAAVAYYGDHNAIQSSAMSTDKSFDNGFELIITNTELSYVIGVSSDNAATAQLVIDRIGDTPIELFGAVPDRTFAQSIAVGTHTTETMADQAVYFVFNARSSGVYKVSVTSDDDGMTVGYYGIPMFVQSTHRGDGEYDGKSFELIIQDPSTPYVLGINATKDTTASLTVERIGDAPFDPMYAEWVEVEAVGPLNKFDTTDKTLVDVDITSYDLSVSLGDDGYYYTNDGKLIYIRITTTTSYSSVDENFQLVPILSGSLALLAGHVDDKVGINVGGYVYDENGNYVNKYRYNNMIKTYMDYVDGKYGVVALTEELANCIKHHGESNGWWNADSNGYIFNGIDINPDNAWLFLCMVEE